MKAKATVKLKPKHAKLLSADARRTRKGADELLAFILDDFFRGWRTDKRWTFYQQFKD